MNLGLDLPRPLVWPPEPGLLDPEWLTEVPREKWNGVQWREYAELRERQAEAQIQARERDLQQARAQLAALQSKLRRAKGQPPQAITNLLDWPVPRKRGRPSGSKATPIAERAVIKLLALRAQSPRRRITREQALAAVLLDDGRRASRAKTMRGVLNEMSRLMRGAQKIAT
ncbi:hypothetical protein ACIPRI_12625 [Variovorax sp. LARHSF232]